MSETFSGYDAADYLNSPKQAAAYLEAAFEDAGDDAGFIVHALGTIARSGSVNELARRTGMSREGLYAALADDGDPSLATVLKVTRALGLDLRVTVHT